MPDTPCIQFTIKIKQNEIIKNADDGSYYHPYSFRICTRCKDQQRKNAKSCSGKGNVQLPHASGCDDGQVW
jgi:hypothetical protein